jgi:fatty-acyl-CoA synthase
MDGLMMDRPLLVKQIAERAATIFGAREVVARTQDGIERSTYAQVVERARRLASALTELGVKPGDRVASFAWNSIRHLELYLAVPSTGAVLHTLNVRLFEEDLRYITSHADDRIVFVDASLAGAMPDFEATEREVVMPDGPGGREGALDYEELIAGGDPGFEFGEFDENTAAAMCYTSGTTGRPKGVLYSHRSIVLHTLGAGLPDSMGIREADSAMPVVPMFHAMAWGIPYVATMVGARQVLPGPDLSPGGLADLIAKERVTWTAGVPTIWNGMLELDPPPDLSSLRELKAGGAAVPESLIRGFAERFGISLVQGWGMTETSPLASWSAPPRGTAPEEEVDWLVKSGRVMPLVEVRVMGMDGNEQPWDGESVGELQLRGPWVTGAYLHAENTAEKFDDGWLRTGDLGTVGPGGWIVVRDRLKDGIKSGGEWISTVELENVIAEHPAVVEATVVGVPDPKWDERPLACVSLAEGAAVSSAELRDFLEGRVAHWWIPERWTFLDAIPKTSVGKYDKRAVRRLYRDGEMTIEIGGKST